MHSPAELHLGGFICLLVTTMMDGNRDVEQIWKYKFKWRYRRTAMINLIVCVITSYNPGHFWWEQYNNAQVIVSTEPPPRRYRYTGSEHWWHLMTSQAGTISPPTYAGHRHRFLITAASWTLKYRKLWDIPQSFAFLDFFSWLLHTSPRSCLELWLQVLLMVSSAGIRSSMYWSVNYVRNCCHAFC